MRKKFIKSILIVFVLITQLSLLKAQTQEIDLSGQWGFQTDLMDFRRGSLDIRYMHRLQESILLPGITDDYKIGYKSPYRHIDRLTRVYEYMGPAWYQREITIPKEWKGKRIFISFERVHWLSSIYVDTKEVSEIDYISVPHNHELTDFVKPGKTHLITVCVDNRYQYNTHKWDHAHSEYTQINWNGILGEMKLVALDPVYIEDMQLYPNVSEHSVKVRMKILNHTHKLVTGKAFFTISGEQYKQTRETMVSGNDSVFYVEDIIALGKDIRLWDEFTPNLYTLQCDLATTTGSTNYQHTQSATFGMREIKADRDNILINGHRVHLRGTVENAVFPKTGYAPVDDASWERILTILKDYGMNHMRFHSWCPPAAAFRTADKLGIYLEVEMPMWGKDAEPDEKRYDFFRREQKAILKEYGNHPSFCFWSLGNELQGDFSVMDKLLTTIKQQDSRHLYMTTTFTFEPGHGSWPEPNDDFWVTQWTRNGWVRGQGIFDDQPASFNKDFSSAIEGLSVPLITHEIGQYSVFPNLKEIDKYTGNLMPLNFKAVAADLKKKGRLHLAEGNLMASGKLATILYKEEIERALKTPGFSGFQLLDLHDFPGQGTALVGIIDAFWESKGLITPEEFRNFCSPVVPLARFEKATYVNNETFKAQFEAANFSDKVLSDIQPEWRLSDSKGTVIAQGNLDKQEIPVGNAFNLGSISVPLESISVADQLTLSIRFTGTQYQNSWNVWVYPQEVPEVGKEIFYTRSFADAEKALSQGKKVLLNPEKEEINGLEGKFVQVFWSPVHFPNQPGTMGILCDPAHPALVDFPTEMHSNWQWWDICKNATTMELDSLKNNMQPIVRMVDNFYKNRNLGLLFEVKAGDGKLLVCSSDLAKNLNTRPVARQLRYSLLKYMESDKFNPQEEVAFKQIKQVLHNVNRTKEVKKSIYE